MRLEQRIRAKQKEQDDWFITRGYGDLVEYTKTRGYSEAALIKAMTDVFEEDIRELTTGKRSK